MRINQQELEKKIQIVLEEKLTSTLKSSTLIIEKKIKELARNLLVRSPEYQSLHDGLLKDVFGLDDPDIALHDINNKIQESLSVVYFPAKFIGGNITGGIYIKMIKSDLEDLLHLTNVHYTSKSGLDIEWFKWLITEGDSVIILKQGFNYEASRGLTGVSSLEEGGGFRVPPQFSGVINDNWITKTFNVDALVNLLRNMIADEIKGKW